MPIVGDPTLVEEADGVLLESTYGDRVHPDTPWRASNGSSTNGGAPGALLPLCRRSHPGLIWTLRRPRTTGGSILPVFVDSPMAIDGTEIARHPRIRRRHGPRVTRSPAGSALIRAPQESS
jgi:metallo-beta-lactamase family protein